MPDVTSAPAAIAAWRELRSRFETILSDLSQFSCDVGDIAEAMGDFSIGGEGDVRVAVFRLIRDHGLDADELMGAYIARLEQEYSGSIEAAIGKTSTIHRPMQEV